MRQHILAHKVFWFYLFAFAISWPAWSIMAALNPAGGAPDQAALLSSPRGLLTIVFSSLGGLGPLLALAALERLSGKAIRVGQVLSQIKFRREAWFLPAIFALPAAIVLGDILAFLLGREPELRLIQPGPAGLGLLVLPIMAVQFTASLVTSPLFEEPGWRGFALGELQGRYGRFAGSLLVGGLWWLWHQPMNLVFGLAPSLYTFASMVAFSFMIDSLFNLSGGNLFTALLAHASSNTANTFLYQGQDNLATLALLVGFVVLLRLLEWRRASMMAPKTPLPLSPA